MVLSLPALEHLRADYTEVWVAGQNASLIRFADRVRSIASTGLDLLGLPGVCPPPALLDALARFDSIVSWYGTGREEFREAVGRLPFRFLTALPEEDAGMHAADFFLKQAGGTGNAIPRLPCVPCPHGRVVIHPFSGSRSKNWPLDRFAALRDRFDAAWCAGPEEALPGAVRMEDLYELACWLAGARLYVGNDSGITHLAAAAGVPVVALFGPTNPAVWSPRGEKVRVVAAPEPGGSMERIPLQDVLKAVESMW